MSLLADLNERESLRRKGQSRITLADLRDGWSWVDFDRAPLFAPGRLVVTTDAATGAKNSWRVVAFNADRGHLDVEPWK